MYGRTRATVLFLSGAAFLFTHCGSSDSTSPSTPSATSTTTVTTTTTAVAATPNGVAPAANLVITINGIDGGMSFSPATATLKVGQSVAWMNADVITHTPTADDG